MPIHVVDKPLGLTSHDVVSRARRILGTRRVGHGGTLDPLASGVLVILSDDSTKLSPFLSDATKSYLAWVSFGATTPTLDAEGPLIDRVEAPDLSGQRIALSLPHFLELSSQVPPKYSAVKQGGVKGYQAARQGRDLELKARPAGYERIELLDVAASRDELPRRVDGAGTVNEAGREVELPDPLATLPSALFALEVRAGTYIRSFARDLGERLGVPAFLSGLLRTGAGKLGLQRAVPLERLGEAQPVPLSEAVPLPSVSLDEAEAARVRQGQRLPLRLVQRSALVDPAGDLVAVAETDAEGRMKLLRVWS